MSTADPTTDLDSTVEQLMKFSPAQRVEIGERLLASVPPPGVERTEEEWKQEIERRVKEYEADPSSVVPAGEVDEHVRQQIEETRRLQDAS